LDALVLKAEQIGQRMRQGRLADAGYIFDQKMATRQKAAQGQFELMPFAEDDGVGGG
jgi:hypothetical protein